MTERRGKKRFPIYAGVVIKEQGGEQTAELKNISSTGLLVRYTGPGLEMGSFVEVRIPWPAQRLSAKLKLWLMAQVIRKDGELVALRIGKYEFRTSGKRAELAALMAQNRPSDWMNIQ